MRLYIIILTFAISLISNEVFSQKSIYVNIGYGNYELTSLKNFHSLISSSFPVVAKHTTNFPNTLYPEIEFSFKNSNHYSLGTFLRYQSSGSRYYYEDYSGIIYNDLIFEGVSLGLINSAIIHSSEKSQTSIPIRVGLNYAKIYSKAFVEVYEEKVLNTERFYSYGASLYPEISHTRIFNSFLLRCKFGYELCFSSKTFIKGDKDSYLIDKNGDKVRVEFNGFRVLFAVGYQF